MPALLIRKPEGDFQNILIRDVQTRVAAHIQIPANENHRRVVTAMPAGKAALCFETTRPAGWMIAETISPFADANGQNGVQFTLSSNAGPISIPCTSILMNHTLMARFGIDPDHKNENRLMALIQSGQIREVEADLEMSLQDLSTRGTITGPVFDAHRNTVTFSRRALDGKHRYQLEFAGDSDVEIRVEEDGLLFTKKSPFAAERIRLTIRASTDFERLTPMPFGELVNDCGKELLRSDAAFAEAVRNFEFLSFNEKFLAGSWNFLSYFGRDTLIATRLMWRVLSEQAKETAIQSVTNEISEDGIVNVTDEWTDDRTVANAIECFFRAYDKHDLTEARQIMQTILSGHVPEHPFLDVLDQTFMFPAMTFHWFMELSDAELSRWLNGNHQVLGRTESNLTTLLRNWNYLLKSAEPHIRAWQTLRAKYPGLTPQQIAAKDRAAFQGLHTTLIHSIAGAANWRDTYNLPWHFCSEDINVNLLPMALIAIQEMVARIGGMNVRPLLIDASAQYGLEHVRAYLEEPSRFNSAKEIWNWDLMREHFLIKRDVREIRRDFEQYLEGLRDGDVFGENRDRGSRERDAFLKSREDHITVSEFLYSDRTPSTLKTGVEFTALLIDPEGCHLPIMHSDDVFSLLFGTPGIDQVRKIIRPLLWSYPFGLAFLEDKSGFAVTNAVYSPKNNQALNDPNKNVWVKFGPDEYHGRGAWPWVIFGLICGIHNQVMHRIDLRGNLRDGILPADLDQFSTVLEQLKSSIAHLGPLATSEVFKYAPANPGTGTWQAEPLWISTPIQLWSAAPANLLIDEALERIELQAVASALRASAFSVKDEQDNPFST